MTVAVIGDSVTAENLRAMLIAGGHNVSGDGAYQVTVEIDEASHAIVIDGVACALERAAEDYISELTEMPVMKTRAGGVIRSDRALRVIAPSSAGKAVAIGTFRALDSIGNPPKKSFMRRLFR